jgi:quercetin dioxygenase-like cupin family protein
MYLYVPANTRPSYQMPGRQVTFLITNEATGGHSCTMEMVYEPGGEINLHTHRDNDEQIYILDGAATIWIDRQRIRPSVGDLVFIPRGVVHAIERDAGAVRLLKTYTPGDIELDMRRRFGLPERGDSD